MVTFEPGSIYGQRAGFLKGLMVTVSRRHTCLLTNPYFPAPSVLLLMQSEARSPASGNVFWKSPGWRRGVVSDVAMLPRNEMFKEFTPGLTMQAAMTDAQEQRQVPRLTLSFRIPCQVAAGTSLVRKLQEALVGNTSVERLAWVDGFGYDAFPSLACLEALHCLKSLVETC